MTDELVKRLLDIASPLADEAAGVIHRLTSDRDRAYTCGYSDAETEISKSALGQDNTFLHSQYANAKLCIEALTVERDQLYQLVQQALSIFENCSVSTDTCCCGDSMSSHGDAISCGHTPVDMGDYQSSLWLSEARNVLKEGMK